jgi:hypothetical protein
MKTSNYQKHTDFTVIHCSPSKHYLCYWLKYVSCYYNTSPQPRQFSWYSNGLQAGWLVFDSWQGNNIFLFFTVSRLAMWPTQSPIQWVQGGFCPRTKWPGHETEHSPSSSAKVKNGRANSLNTGTILLFYLHYDTPLNYICVYMWLNTPCVLFRSSP